MRAEEEENSCQRKWTTTLNPRKKPSQTAIAILVINISVSSTICLWMSQAIGTDELSEKLMSLQHDWDCAKCVADSSDKKRCKKCSGPGRLQIKSRITEDEFPSWCLERPDCHENIERMVREESSRKKAELLREGFTDALHKAMTAMYQSPRVIVHWFPLHWKSIEKNNSGEIVDYERHRSTYTVSSGPEGSFDDGRLVVTSTGLYYVYAKLTFECTEADQRLKHFGTDVVLEDPSRTTRSPILWERAKAKCKMKGDLETLFQRGIFRLTKDSSLTLRYKTSDHVRISSTRDQAYKSCLGMYKVGP